MFAIQSNFMKFPLKFSEASRNSKLKDDECLLTVLWDFQQYFAHIKPMDR